MTVSINTTDDNDDEGDEVFGLVLKRTDDITPDTVQIVGPTTALGIIEDNDEPGTNLSDYNCSISKFTYIILNYRSKISG